MKYLSDIFLSKIVESKPSITNTWSGDNESLKTRKIRKNINKHEQTYHIDKPSDSTDATPELKKKSMTT